MSDKKLTKADKIAAICEAMESWDQETLIDMAKDMRSILLSKESMKTINSLYDHEVLAGTFSDD
jgi:hypothetical protein